MPSEPDPILLAAIAINSHVERLVSDGDLRKITLHLLDQLNANAAGWQEAWDTYQTYVSERSVTRDLQNTRMGITA